MRKQDVIQEAINQHVSSYGHPISVSELSWLLRSVLRKYHQAASKTGSLTEYSSSSQTIVELFADRESIPAIDIYNVIRGDVIDARDVNPKIVKALGLRLEPMFVVDM